MVLVGAAKVGLIGKTTSSMCHWEAILCYSRNVKKIAVLDRLRATLVILMSCGT